MFNTLLVTPLFNLLVLIFALLPGHDFGIALIILTVLVRLALWPLVSGQLHSQRALQRLAPEAAKVKAKAGGDKQLESKLLMELYKEKGVNPFSSLVPLFVQLPILLALFFMIRDIVQNGGIIGRLAYEPLRQLPYVAGIIRDAGQFHPSLLGLVDLSKPSLVLAVAAGLGQFWQAKQLQPAKSSDPQARMMAMTTFIFPFLTIFIAMTLPSALALFWTVTSLVAIFQQHLVLRQDARDLSEPEVAVTTRTIEPATKKKRKKRSK